MAVLGLPGSVNAGFRARTATSFCPVQKEAKRLGQRLQPLGQLLFVLTTDKTTHSG
jgi:hypothetical protein